MYFGVDFSRRHFYDLAMKHKIPFAHLAMLVSACALLALPITTHADGALTLSSPLIITEVLPGTEQSASEEFIEIYNQSKTVIDLTKDAWVVQIASSKATTWTGAKSVKLNGLIYPGTYIIIGSTYTSSGTTKGYLSEYANAQFSAGLTATSGHVRVGKTATAPAVGLQYADIVEWSTKESNGSLTSPGIDEATVLQLDASIKAGSSIKRTLATDNRFISSGDQSQDFMLSVCPSPTSNSSALASVVDASIFEPLPTNIDTTNPSCGVVPTSDPSDGDGGIVPPAEEPPAVLLPGEMPTTTPGTAEASASVPLADTGLHSPQITELLPNPGTPNTDAQDEFVELYNGNDAAFDLSGFMLLIGTSKSKHVTFPAGTTIAPHSFKAFFSSDFHMSLSNTSGQVTLADPLGKELNATEVYSTAKDDTAWALAQGKWQWTTRPTPGAANIITAPAANAKKASTAKTTKAKTTAKTTASKTKSAKASASTDMAVASNVEPGTPLHPLTLAVVGGFALLYGAYEYRRDVANKFNQLRGYRAARRASRQEPEGR